MINRRKILISTFASLAFSLMGHTTVLANQQIPVVATFSILGDMVKRIGGDHVSVKTLVGPGGDAHVYQPTPADARAVHAAKLIFVNGLEFEGWLDRLIETANFEGMRVVTTEGIKPIPFEEEDHHDDDHAEKKHDDDHTKEEHGEEHAEEHGDEHEHHHGAYDPHAWQSLEKAVTYVDNITAALARAEPDNATFFYKNRAVYIAEIKKLDAEIRDLVASLPEERRTIVTSHDAFGYFAQEYGLVFEAPQGLSTESDPSAADVARMITQIRKKGISAIFVESITDNRLLEQIARETKATIGGTLYSDALSAENGPASTYLKMMRHNAMTITRALGS